MRILGLFSLFLSFFLSGCVGIGVYRPPNIEKPGVNTIGVGIPITAGLFESRSSTHFFGVPLFEVYGRRGINKHSDFGWRFPYILFTGDASSIAASVDFRYALNDSDPRTIGSIQINGGISTFQGYAAIIPGLSLSIRSNHLFGAQPIIVFSGSEVFQSEGFRVFYTTRKNLGRGRFLDRSISFTVLKSGDLYTFYLFSLVTSFVLRLGK